MKDIERLKKEVKMDIKLDSYVPENTSLIKFSAKSKRSHNIAELAQKYGEGPPKFYPKTFEVMKNTGRFNRLSYQDVTSNPVDYRKSITTEELDALKSFVKSLGAHDIGFTEVDTDYIFKDRKILHKNAVVLTMAMDPVAISLAPSRETGHEVHSTYNKLGKISVEVANYLRKLGFSAQAGPALGGDVDYRHLAQQAGIGMIGNHGLLISPSVGPRQRITAIYTSIENLMPADFNPHVWIRDYCMNCQLCQSRCPGSAIIGIKGSEENNEYIDMPKCAKVFSTNFGCSVCIKECIFNKLEYDNVYDIYRKNVAK